MAPFVEDSFFSSLFDPTTAAVASDAHSSVAHHSASDSSSSMFLSTHNNVPNSVAQCLPRTTSASAAPLDWGELPSDVVESLVNYLSSTDDEAFSSFANSPASSPDSAVGAYGGSSNAAAAALGSVSPSFALSSDWWNNGGSMPLAFDTSDNFGVVPTSAFAMAHAQPQQPHPHTQAPLLRVPQVSSQPTPPPLPMSPVITHDISPDLSSCCVGKTGDLPVVEPLRGKRVSFKLTADAEAEYLSNKEFYARIREPETRALLVRKSHPVFASLDDAVGSFYILKDVRARKPPLIDAEKFNCHTRRDAGDAHWQYNVPGTDFTCRVTQWEPQSQFETAVYTSYHYYRSPTPRRGASRYSPY